MKQFMNIMVICMLCLSLGSCERAQQHEPIKKPVDTKVYKVVAHRGGYMECGRPDCSISSLKYAIGRGCYASECDIVLTSDDQILVVHPMNGCFVNNLVVVEHTMAEIRAKGKLVNGEQIPTLDDFLDVILDKKMNPNGMKLWIDVKRLSKDKLPMDYMWSVKACLRACEIIKSRNAEDICEFLIPTGTDIFDAVKTIVVDEYGINLAWMTCTSPARYGKAWAQLSYSKILGNKPSSSWRPMDYIEAGVPLSIYGVDSESAMDETIEYYPSLKAIFTNYPNKLIQKLQEAGY